MSNTAPTLFIGMPAHDSRLNKATHNSLMMLVASQKFNLHMPIMSGGGVAVARNKLAHSFMQSPAEYCLWLDGDIDFEPADVVQLYSRQEPIIGGLYPHKTTKNFALSCRGLGKQLDETGKVEVAAVGTGFLMVQKQTCLRIKEAFPQNAYYEDWSDGQGELKHAFFMEQVVCDPQWNIDRPTLLTEDWFFCYTARKAGFKVYADTKVNLGHYEGSVRFPFPGQPGLPEVEAV